MMTYAPDLRSPDSDWGIWVQSKVGMVGNRIGGRDNYWCWGDEDDEDDDDDDGDDTDEDGDDEDDKNKKEQVEKTNRKMSMDVLGVQSEGDETDNQSQTKNVSIIPKYLLTLT